MAVELIMPKNGMTMEEGKIIRWLKNVGDKVLCDEPIIEIETEKTNMEYEAPASGTLLVKYHEDGETVPVLTLLGYIGEADEIVPEQPSSAVKNNDRKQSSVVPNKDENYTNGIQKDILKHDYDIAFIGGGPAGYAGAIHAAQMGAKTILFERDKLGGTCLNRGCIPTKTYLKSAECLFSIQKAKNLGIDMIGEVQANLTKIYERKEGIVLKLRNGIEQLMKSNSITVINAEAVLSGDHEISVSGTQYSAGKIILCTGSRVKLPSIRGIEHPDVLTSDTILEIQEIPKKLCIIGGGIIGCEIGCAFQLFGSEVVILEAMPNILSDLDDDIINTIHKSLISLGIRIEIGVKVQQIENPDGKPVAVTGTEKYSCDKVLVVTGRVPELNCLGMMSDKIKLNKGFVEVNEYMETCINGIYAAGDINGKLMLAHAASRMAEIAVENALGVKKACILKYTPNCLYTIPEAACVGLSKKQALEKYGNDIVIGQSKFSVNGRAYASGEPEGFVHVFVRKQYGEILGVQIVGTAAAELISEPASLMSCEITAHEVVEGMLHAHPTYSEAFMEACADALKRNK